MVASKSLFPKAALALGALLLSLVSVGCGAAYPHEVEIEYRVTSETVSAASVTYTNTTGGMSSLDDASLPFTITVPRSVDLHDSLGLSADTPEGGDLTLEIWVDGERVKQELFSGDSFVSGIVVHVFE